MPESRAYTEDEVRNQVLDHVWRLIDYWLKETDRQTERERMEGLAFTFLSMLDGSSSLPSFTVSPSPHPTDEAYHRENGENFYVPCDIAGSLHELFYGRKPELATSPEGLLVAEITRLRKIERVARVLYENMKGTCDHGEPKCQEPSFAGFMHGMCNAHAEELDAPVGALKDQTMLNDLREALEP